MPGIGQQLTAAREARGMTADDVAKRLRIRAMFVNALEREDWPAVGEPVYARGFLKNYAKLVGLDAEAVAAALDSAYLELAARPDVPLPVRDEYTAAQRPAQQSGAATAAVSASGTRTRAEAGASA